MGRRIGMADVRCLKGSCEPWTRAGCSSCIVRPMKIYQGNAGSHKVIERCWRDGVGVMVSLKWKNPSRFPYHALDNGAYSAWVNKREWDQDAFEVLLGRILDHDKRPDFVICPDKVAAGVDSLRFSLEWRDRNPDAPYYLAVQDGMALEDVEPHIRRFAGIFVGGTLPWKMETSPLWVRLAHRHRRPCHIGKMGPLQRILWAARIGADSIDSTTWVQRDSWYHIEGAKRQDRLAIEEEG